MPQRAKYNIPNQEMLIKGIGKNISTLRKSRGITQQELADMIGITQKLLSHYEVGRSKLSSEILFMIAKSLNVSADDILDLKENPDISTPSRKIMKRLKGIENLPENKQKMLLQMIDMFLRDAESSK